MNKTLKDKKAVKKYYDQYYLAEHTEYLTEKRSLAEAKQLIKWMGKKPQSVCDVSCGNGRHLLAFSKLGIKKGYGFDLSTKLIENAKESLSSNKNYKVEVKDFNN